MGNQFYSTLKLVRHFRKTKNRNHMEKAISQKIHALKRFHERYGQEITSKQYKDMCHMVRSNKAEILERQSNRVSKMKLVFNGLDVYFCYDHQRHTINTFLKPEWVLNPTNETDKEMVKEIENDMKENTNE